MQCWGRSYAILLQASHLDSVLHEQEGFVRVPNETRAITCEPFEKVLVLKGIERAVAAISFISAKLYQNP